MTQPLLFYIPLDLQKYLLKKVMAVIKITAVIIFFRIIQLVINLHPNHFES